MISAMILAAGESKRMGNQNKLLLPFRGITMVENIVDTLVLLRSIGGSKESRVDDLLV